VIVSKKSLGVQNIVELELDQNSSKTYINKDGIISHNCRWCSEFYVDNDGSPKLYKLTSLLDNGSNYGKKRDTWQAVIGATHPNERCSGILELKPGFMLKSDGTSTYIGMAKWPGYILNKVQK
jgi:hypothetical protein